MSKRIRDIVGAARNAIVPFYKRIPARYKLPLAFRYSLLSGNCENELRFLGRIVQEVPSRKVAIDVGANKGLFAFNLSRRFHTVYAFEINDDLTGDLAALNSTRIHILHEGLSSRRREATFYIPVLDGVALTGYGSLAPGNCPETDQHIEKTVRIRPLDDLAIADVGFIKIDVEGHEIEVLKGATATITKNRPVVLIEVKDENLEEVSAFFAHLNYQRKKLHDLMNAQSSEENFIFLPA